MPAKQDAVEDSSDKARRRISKACDRCRRVRSKCEPSLRGAEHPCKSCSTAKTECTFIGPSHKRGPTKGYTEGMTTHMLQLEGLLRALITCQDPALQSVFTSIAQDRMAHTLVEKIRTSAVEESNLNQKKKAKISTEPNAFATDEDPTQTQLDWQVRLQELILSRIESPANPLAGPNGDSDSPVFQHPVPDPLKEMIAYAPHPLQPSDDLQSTPVNVDRPFSAVSHATRTGKSDITLTTATPILQHQRDSASPTMSKDHLSPTHDTSEGSMHQADIALSELSHAGPSNPTNLNLSHNQFPDADDLTVAIGQLSVDEENHVSYYGRSSGLHLLASVVEQVDSREKTWRRSASSRAMVSNPLNCLPAGMHLADYISPADYVTGLPSHEQQEYLLQVYFVHVHPHLPILHAGDIMRSFRNMHGVKHPDSAPDKQLSKPIPRMLLLAIYAVAARCRTEPDSLTADDVHDLGSRFFEEARKALGQEQALNKITTCQVLLILTYHEIGVGEMAHAWHLIGTAVRTAQEIGLHRSVEMWPSEISSRFSSNEKQTFRRIWHMCVLLDKYTAMCIGRPTAVIDSDHDTQSPDLDDNEDVELFHLTTALEPHVSTISSAIAMACLRARIQLAAIISSISQKVYSIRQGTVDRHSELRELAARLHQWRANLPEHLWCEIGLDAVVPPPAVMSTHIIYWTSYILLFRPFIRLPDLSTLNDQDEALVAANKECATFAYNECRCAASNVTAIASLFVDTHGPKKIPTFISYFIFTASNMHVTVLLGEPHDLIASAGLAQCMDFLKRMQVVWANAGQYWDMLHGWKVYLHNIEEQRIHPLPRPGKRPADEEFHFSRPAPARLVVNDSQHLTHDSAQGIRSNIHLMQSEAPSSRPLLPPGMSDCSAAKDPWSILPTQHFMAFGMFEENPSPLHPIATPLDISLNQPLQDHDITPLVSEFDSHWMDVPNLSDSSIRLFGTTDDDVSYRPLLALDVLNQGHAIDHESIYDFVGDGGRQHWAQQG